MWTIEPTLDEPYPRRGPNGSYPQQGGEELLFFYFDLVPSERFLLDNLAANFSNVRFRVRFSCPWSSTPPII